VVNPTERLTAEEALAHPWVRKDAVELSNNDLGRSLERMRRSNFCFSFVDFIIILPFFGCFSFRSRAAKKWRVSIKAVMAVNKMQRLSQALAQSREMKEKESLFTIEEEPLTTERMLKHAANSDVIGTTSDHSEAMSEVDYGTDAEGEIFTSDKETEASKQLRYAELLEEEC